MQRAGKKEGKNRRKSSRRRRRRSTERKREQQTAIHEAEEQERLRKWEECWEKKVQAQEDRDFAECCAAKGLCVRPRTQSNIWINVTRDRSLQEINITVKNVPVPRPKPPPLPPLKPQRRSEDAAAGKRTGKKVHKKIGTGKRKRKRK